MFITKIGYMKKTHKNKEKVNDLSKPISTNVCATCHRLIGDEYYISCTKCENYHQCLNCFSIGSQNNKHLKTHPFVLLTKCNKQVYEKGWTLFEEISLLIFLQQHGIDNWDTVSFLLSTKTPEECRKHYERVYLNHNLSPEPMSYLNKKFDMNTESNDDFYLLDGSLSQPIPPIHHTKKQPTFTYGDIAGYMPKRDEYEAEALPEAEQLIDKLFFSADLDTEDSFKEKLERLMQYSGAVEMRQMQHDFVNSRQLQNKNVNTFTSILDQTPELKNPALTSSPEYLNLFIPLSHFFNPEDCTEMIKILKNEESLREKCNHLQKWIDNDILTRNEGYLYDIISSSTDTSDELITSKIVSIITHQKEFINELTNSLLTDDEKRFCFENDIEANEYQEIKDFVSLYYIKQQRPLNDVDFIEINETMQDEEALIAVLQFFVSQGFLEYEGTKLQNEEL